METFYLSLNHFQNPPSYEKLVDEYNKKINHSFEEIVEFHVNFERIHPFQDGNGRVGRLIAFKECLKNNLVPFIILNSKKEFYYRGLKNWNQERGWLIDTCLDGQDAVNYRYDGYLLGIPFKVNMTSLECLKWKCVRY